MDTYLDLNLRPDPEFAPTALLNAAFMKLHRVLALGAGSVGLSFPGFDDRRPTLGDCLRLHGTRAALMDLADLEWLGALRDNLQTTGLAAVPVTASHRIVRRVQVKSSPERARRRLVARRGVSVQEAHAAIPDTLARRSALPFLTVASGSTGQSFRLFVQHGPVVTEPSAGSFSAYGLSSTATVPWF